ncbi:MAG: undecaprenyl-diphosphatase UppP [Chloroflexota bacterium]
MEIIRAIILGVIQGATEFIPISSSGHLVIVPWLLGWPHSSLLFDAIVHWGTLVAILLFFWRDFWQMIVAGIQSILRFSLDDPMARLAWFVVVGSIPAALFGLLFKDFIEGLFEGNAAPLVAGISLLITAALLSGSELMTKRLSQAKPLQKMSWGDAIFVGVAQVLALLPGVSRSGSTIAAGLARGIQREDAARFSFLLGTPAFLGAGLLQIADALAEDSSMLATEAPGLLAGFIVSAIVGFAAIRFMLAYLRKYSLYIFAAYCLVAGLAVISLYFFR